jgi:hypothetical protein
MSAKPMTAMTIMTVSEMRGTNEDAPSENDVKMPTMQPIT